MGQGITGSICASNSKGMKNAITFDLEDYMHVTAFADLLKAEEWSSCVSRLEHNTDKLLSILDSGACVATFFILGWVSEKFPQVVRRIAEQGHEVACHSLRHRLVYEMTPQEFREDTLDAKALLEDVSGRRVRGYRAPSFSITKNSWWAFEILSELGFTYDSSIFPVRHPNYGLIEASRFPFAVRTASGTVVEFPLPTLEVGGMRAPFAGGAYLRIMPYLYTRWGINYVNNWEARPVCIYLHPWELDVHQPRIKGSLTARLRHYMGLRGTEVKLCKLLRDFEFCPIEVLIGEWQKAEDGETSSTKLLSSTGQR
jgi:polysaccharide deacetylase family protein (PEP-CTERM system associated)